MVSPPFIRGKPISEWPGWLGRVHGIKVPQAQQVKKQPDATGNANIEILCQMIERTRHLPGSIADCGVYQGGSTAGIGLYMREHGIAKTIYAFDSFEGFDPKEVEKELALGGVENEDRHLHGFSGTSLEGVGAKDEALPAGKRDSGERLLLRHSAAIAAADRVLVRTCRRKSGIILPGLPDIPVSAHGEGRHFSIRRIQRPAMARAATRPSMNFWRTNWNG